MNHKNNKKPYRSIIDMVVLGILTKQPMNAYALAQYVEKNQITRLVKLSTPAIYKSCRRLYEQRYLHGELKRNGEAPEKMLYKVTETGAKWFYQLMSHYAETLSPFYFEINSVIYALESLEFEQGLALINAYQTEIKTMQGWLIIHSKEDRATVNFASRMIVKQYLMTIETLVKWIEMVKEEFTSQYK